MLEANCPYTRELLKNIDEANDFHHRFELQRQYFDLIEPLLCKKGEEVMVCCNQGNTGNIYNLLFQLPHLFFYPSVY